VGGRIRGSITRRGLRTAMPDVPFELRHASADDAGTVAALATQVFLDTYATEGVRPDLARESRGLGSAWLAAGEGNARALWFYARCGYTDVGETVYRFEGRAYRNRIFVKSLAAGQASATDGAHELSGGRE
jgi:hypothetical protein